MSRQSRKVHLPGEDEAILEGHASMIAATQGIKFDEAKEKIVDEYKKNINKATSGGKVDEDKFRENMDEYIKQSTR